MTFGVVFPQRCAEGYYSGAAAASCSQCPAGKMCYDGANYVSPSDCSAGTYSGLGDVICTNCDSGTRRVNFT